MRFYRYRYKQLRSLSVYRYLYLFLYLLLIDLIHLYLFVDIYMNILLKWREMFGLISFGKGEIFSQLSGGSVVCLY